MSPEPEGSADISLKTTTKISGDDNISGVTTTAPNSTNTINTDLLSYTLMYPLDLENKQQDLENYHLTFP